MLENAKQNPIPWIVVAVVIFILYNQFRWQRDRSRISRLGSFAPIVPSYLPFGVDIAYRAIKNYFRKADLEQWQWMFSHARFPCNTAEFHAAGQRFIVTADPENIKALLATQFGDFGKGEEFHEEWREFLGDSIFTTDGDLWHGNRQMIRPQFVKERVKDLDIFERHLQKVIGQFGGVGQKVDIALLFYRYTLDAATDYLLGETVGSLDRPQAEFAAAFDHVQRIHALKARVGGLSFLIPRFGFKRSIALINTFVQPFIDAALRLDRGDVKETANQTFLQAIASQGITDRKLIRDQLVAILLAGRDTTASALSFLFLELSRHPDILYTLRTEIEKQVGNKKRPTYEDLKAMPYLRDTINETLRLYPGVPFNRRTALRDTTLPIGGGPSGKDPIGILKGTPVGYSPLYLHRRNDLYPGSETGFPLVDDFRPERWAKWQPKPWQYIPFNGGPRICVGQQFALIEIAYTAVRILQRFDRIDDLTSHDGPSFRSEVVIAPADGVHVGLWECSRQSTSQQVS